ncbi:MAG: aminodeoxychorismate lyase [Gammaproteobacteria bacterium]|nr:aminodeoxychorismate lyase [Gammaproteobacteria bacterium]
MIQALVNGNESEDIPIADRGFQYGDGVFETLAVHHGQPLLWDAHVQRLLAGCHALRFGVRPDMRALEQEARHLCAHLDKAVLKIVITRGAGPRGYRAPANPVLTRVVSVSPWPETDTDKRTRGVRVRLCRTVLATQTQLAGLKHLNRLEQILARAEWNDEWDEGLMCDQSGFVIEATMSNLFAVINGALHTPNLTACGVAGVMRNEVIRVARRMYDQVKIADLPVDQVYAAEELFLTNSIIGIWPVRAVEEQVFAIGPLTRTLWRALNDQPNQVVVD